MGKEEVTKLRSEIADLYRSVATLVDRLHPDDEATGGAVVGQCCPVALLHRGAQSEPFMTELPDWIFPV